MLKKLSKWYLSYAFIILCSHTVASEKLVFLKVRILPKNLAAAFDAGNHLDGDAVVNFGEDAVHKFLDFIPSFDRRNRESADLFIHYRSVQLQVGHRVLNTELLAVPLENKPHILAAGNSIQKLLVFTFPAIRVGLKLLDVSYNSNCMGLARMCNGL